MRADNSDFDRLVPQTDATFQYDKFNRLRLRNEVTSVAKTSQHHHAHLQNQTDLVRLHVPRFTVSANDRHFQAISNIVTNLVLFTDAAHKTRAEKLEGLLFSYDFTNLASAADVVANMQQRLRQVGRERGAREEGREVRDPGELPAARALPVEEGVRERRHHRVEDEHREESERRCHEEQAGAAPHAVPHAMPLGSSVGVTRSA